MNYRKNNIKERSLLYGMQELNMIKLKNSCYIDSQKILHTIGKTAGKFSIIYRLNPLRNKESIKQYTYYINKHKTLSFNFRYYINKSISSFGRKRIIFTLKYYKNYNLI